MNNLRYEIRKHVNDLFCGYLMKYLLIKVSDKGAVLFLTFMYTIDKEMETSSKPWY